MKATGCERLGLGERQGGSESGKPIGDFFDK